MADVVCCGSMIGSDSEMLALVTFGSRVGWKKAKTRIELGFNGDYYRVIEEGRKELKGLQPTRPDPESWCV